MTRPQPPPDDELEQLPPLDGGEDDAADDDTDELEGNDPADDGASLDDSTGENDPVDAAELDVDEQDTGWLDEPADAADLDVGVPLAIDAADEEQNAADDAEVLGVGNEDYGLGDGPEQMGLDGGDEGPLDPDEDLRDEDLPDLDADEEGDFSDEGLLDERAGAALDDPFGVPWAREPWPCVGAPVVLAAATAMACAGRGALVAVRGSSGTELVLIDLEGTRLSLAAEALSSAEVSALSVDGDRVAALVEGGDAFVSDDRGARFDPRPEAAPLSDVVLIGEQLWGLTRTGELLMNEELLAERIVAVARDGTSGLLAMAVDETRRPVSLLRGRSPASGRLPVGVPIVRETLSREVPAMGPPRLAARGSHVAYAARRGVARRDAGGSWHAFAWDGQVTALTFVADDGTLLVATYADADDTTGLVRLDASGQMSVVARVGAVQGRVDCDGNGNDGRVVALACDDPHGVVWVAGGFGVTAFSIR